MLIGPIPHIKRVRVINDKTYVCYVPDYSHPGVSERVKLEVDEIEDMCYDKRKL